MKLDKAQLQQIQRFLDRMELHQEDLKNEVLDHMALSIEGHLDRGTPFNEAFALVRNTWQGELKLHQSFWLGLLWTGPKILMDKCAQLTKRAYLRSAIWALLPMGVIYVFGKGLPMALWEAANTAVGGMYLLFFSWLLYANVRIRATKRKSSYRFLFKVHAIAFGFLLVLYNPLFSDIFGLVQDGAMSMPALAVHAFTLAFCYSLVRFYQLHMQIKWKPV
ncbi:hypothetical protein [Maribacter sp. 2307ULW6-5]|uniref:hypothetical protein n=1 Tax=Maribacter sp. 2307ULW6-5 TaxID=3386275 RepID=UPI0039BC2E0E